MQSLYLDVRSDCFSYVDRYNRHSTAFNKIPVWDMCGLCRGNITREFNGADFRGWEVCTGLASDSRCYNYLLITGSSIVVSIFLACEQPPIVFELILSPASKTFKKRYTSKQIRSVKSHFRPFSSPLVKQYCKVPEETIKKYRQIKTKLLVSSNF